MRINSNIHHNKKLYLPKNLRSFIVSNWKCSISPWRLNRWKVKLTRLFPKNKMKILIHWKSWNQWLSQEMYFKQIGDKNYTSRFLYTNLRLIFKFHCITRFHQLSPVAITNTVHCQLIRGKYYQTLKKSRVSLCKSVKEVFNFVVHRITIFINGHTG